MTCVNTIGISLFSRNCPGGPGLVPSQDLHCGSGCVTNSLLPGPMISCNVQRYTYHQVANKGALCIEHKGHTCVHMHQELPMALTGIYTPTNLLLLLMPFAARNLRGASQLI